MSYPVQRPATENPSIDSTVKTIRSLDEFKTIQKDHASALVYNRSDCDLFPDSFWQKDCFADGSVYLLEKAARHRLPSYEWNNHFDAKDPLAGRFLREIDELLTLYLDIAETKYANCSLIVKYGQTCPAFHCDHYHSRMICSYTGPATQWTPEKNVRRKHLHGGNPDQRLIDPNQVFQFETGAIAIMKGEAFQGSGRSLVHRSAPDKDPKSPQKRILLRIDH